MRIPFFIIIFCVISIYTHSQVLQGGAKVGLNFPEKPTIRTENSTISDIKTQVKDQSNAYHLGFYLKFNFAGAYLRPEMYYSRFKSEYYDAGGSEFSVSNNRMDFPLLFGYQFLKSVYGHAGFVGQYYFGDETTLSDVQDVTYQDFRLGYQLGVGVEFGKISFEGRYEGAFSDRTISYVNDNSAYEIQSNGSQFLLSMGYKF